MIGFQAAWNEHVVIIEVNTFCAAITTWQESGPDSASNHLFQVCDQLRTAFRNLGITVSDQ